MQDSMDEKEQNMLETSRKLQQRIGDRERALEATEDNIAEVRMEVEHQKEALAAQARNLAEGARIREEVRCRLAQAEQQHADRQKQLSTWDRQLNAQKERLAVQEQEVAEQLRRQDETQQLTDHRRLVCEERLASSERELEDHVRRAASRRDMESLQLRLAQREEGLSNLDADISAKQRHVAEKEQDLLNAEQAFKEQRMVLAHQERLLNTVQALALMFADVSHMRRNNFHSNTTALCHQKTGDRMRKLSAQS